MPLIKARFLCLFLLSIRLFSFRSKRAMPEFHQPVIVPISLSTADKTSSTFISAMHFAFMRHRGVYPNFEQGEQGRFLDTTMWCSPLGAHFLTLLGPNSDTVGTPNPAAMCNKPESPLISM